VIALTQAFVCAKAQQKEDGARVPGSQNKKERNKNMNIKNKSALNRLLSVLYILLLLTLLPPSLPPLPKT